MVVRDEIIMIIDTLPGSEKSSITARLLQHVVST
jgi:hypothetical protein